MSGIGVATEPGRTPKEHDTRTPARMEELCNLLLGISASKYRFRSASSLLGRAYEGDITFTLFIWLQQQLAIQQDVPEKQLWFQPFPSSSLLHGAFNLEIYLRFMLLVSTVQPASISEMTGNASLYTWNAAEYRRHFNKS